MKFFASLTSKKIYESLRTARTKYPDVPDFIFNAFLSQLRKISKLSGVIYDSHNIKIYKIESFKEAKNKGKSTKWRTSLNKANFDLWIERYNMYIIIDLNKDIDSPFRKICYLVNKIEDCFVTADNRHYFDSDPEYYRLKEYFGTEIMSLMV